VSLLGDAIEYVKKLQRRVEEIESNEKKQEKVSVKQHVEVTIEKTVAITKLSCAWKDGLLIDILQRMTHLQLEVVDATAKVSDGVLKATLKAKVSTDIIFSVSSKFKRPNPFFCEGINYHRLNIAGHDLRERKQRENSRD
jgi:hypothetical protein